MLNCGPSGEYCGCQGAQGPRQRLGLGLWARLARGWGWHLFGVLPPCSCLLLRGRGEKLGLEQTSAFLWESASLWAVRASGLRLALQRFPNCVLHRSPSVGSQQKTYRVDLMPLLTAVAPKLPLAPKVHLSPLPRSWKLL